MPADDSFFDQAISFHGSGNFAGAESIYREILQRNADDPRASHMLGVLAFQTGRAALALNLLHRAIELVPESPEVFSNLGLVLDSVGRDVEAIAAHRHAIALRPTFAQAHLNLGTALQKTGNPDGAALAYRQAVELQPSLSQAHHNLGLLLLEAGLFTDAIAPLRKACMLCPDNADSQQSLANALFNAGEYAAAAAGYSIAVKLTPASFETWNNLGTAFDRLARHPEAANAFETALEIKPDSPDAHYNLASARYALGDHERAFIAIRRTIELRPAWPAAWNNLGIWLQETGAMADAESALQHAVALDPGYAEAHCNLGNLFRRVRRFADAIREYETAISLRPGYAVAMCNIGAVLNLIGRVDEATDALRTAIALRPDLSEAHNNLGNVLKDTGDLTGAVDSFTQALALSPGDPAAHSNLVFTRLYETTGTSQSHRDAAIAWALRHAPIRQTPQHDNDRSPNRRLRIGYVAPDFREHCQSLFTIPLLSHHDRERFEITCYSGVVSPDAVTGRIRSFTDHWRTTVGLGDETLARQIRDDHIDILIDLTVHMADNRLLAFAIRPAPIQVTWLGYPGTTGLPAIDYRLSDPYLDPSGSERDALYIEKTVRLPDTFWCYDPLADVPEVNELPVDRNGVVTFGCLNNFCKVNDVTLRLWARVMLEVRGSRMLLIAPAGKTRNRLLSTLGELGIDAGRVDFVERRQRESYLRTYHRIDIGLDTFPYNGHTTSLDSYWMGVPVVTIVGESSVSRAGWSQLNNLDLRELAACDADGFVAIAVKLAGDLGRLRSLRRSLRQRLLASPLCDGRRFARQVEAAYRHMWNIWVDAGA